MAVLIVLALACLAPLAAQADPETQGPKDEDLRLYLACSRTAGAGLLSFEEARTCSRAFLRIKLSFIPGMTLDDFDGLSPTEKATVNKAGYLSYLDWSRENADRIAALKLAADLSPVIATD